MFSLTRDQKISNLVEQKNLLIRKKENLEQQIQGIERKLSKLESVGTSSPSNQSARELCSSLTEKLKF